MADRVMCTCAYSDQFPHPREGCRYAKLDDDELVTDGVTQGVATALPAGQKRRSDGVSGRGDPIAMWTTSTEGR